VLATSDALATAAGTRQRAQLPGPWAADVAVAIRLDLPVLASRWLPFAYQLAAGQEGDLGFDPLDPVSSLMAFYLSQPGLPPQQALAMLSSSASFRSLLPTDQTAATAAGLYHLDPAGPEVQAHPAMTDHRLVLRTDGGYVLIAPHGHRKTLATLAALQAELLGFTLEDGVAAEHLPLLTVPPRAHFSSRWLPPIPVVLAHLRPYACDVHVDNGQVQAHESGLPVLPLVALALGSLEVDNLNDQLAIDAQHDRMLERQEAKAAAQLNAQAPARAQGAKPAASPPKPAVDEGF